MHTMQPMISEVHSKPKPPAVLQRTASAAKLPSAAGTGEGLLTIPRQTAVTRHHDALCCEVSGSRQLPWGTTTLSSAVCSAGPCNSHADLGVGDLNHSDSRTQDSGSITDLCNTEDSDEVEIVSLVQEQLPRYRLRADSVCEFGGYTHQDWIQAPVIDLDTELHLTDLQISETLKYFLVCAERVSQMTRTYNDPEAVTHLLQQRESDLELAARIGQTLLGKNKELKSRLEQLQEQLSSATEEIHQLKHDLSQKESLLQIYSNDLQNQAPSDSSSSEYASGYSHVEVEMLQRKVGTLEEENSSLRQESAKLHSDTESFEEKEKKLVEDFVRQLGEASQSAESSAKELRQKMEENSQLEEKVHTLLGQLHEIQSQVRQLSIENKDLEERLEASVESQSQLRTELNVQKDKYDELFEMLKEARDELRIHRNRQGPRATCHSYASSVMSGGADSLASELQNSWYQQASPEDGKTTDRGQWKVFETARAAKKAASRSARSTSGLSTSLSSWTDPDSQALSQATSDADSITGDSYCGDLETSFGSFGTLGRPGIPGSNDLHTALRRLESREASSMEEDLLDASRQTRSEAMSPFKLPGTPSSLSSTPSGYSYLGCSNNLHSSSQFKIPSKLQIIKPMEGSATLQHWQRLAQPHLGGLFEHREGVKVKGERRLDLEGEMYTLSDFEEDEDMMQYPGGASRVSPALPCPQSLVSSDSPTSRESRVGHRPLGTSTPEYRPADSRTGSINRLNRSFTMSLGLAAILQDRDAHSTTRALLNSSPLCPVIPADAVATASGGPSSASPPADQDGGSSLNNMQKPGLLGKLLSSGYSMLWNKSASSPAEGASVDSVQSSQSPTPSQLRPQGGPGVLGTLTTLRRKGAL